MVKFGKNKFKALNKIAKGQKAARSSPGASNKILKKKINAEKKVSFQKEILLKEAVAGGDNTLVKNIKATELILKEAKKSRKNKVKEQNAQSKPKPVEKRKKRQKTQINDTKLMLSLMKKNR